MTPPKLDVVYHRQEESLEVIYTVVNNAREAIWLADRLWDYTPEGDIVQDPRPAYLSVHVDGAVKLGRCTHPLPQTQDVEQMIVPFARKVEGMQSVSETLDIQLPLREYNPYYDDPEQDDELPKETTSLQLVLSWVPRLPGMTSRPTAVSGALELHAPELIPNMLTVSSEPVELSVPARRRTDPFERF